MISSVVHTLKSSAELEAEGEVVGTLTTTKTTHPADGSPRWIVSGPNGRIVYDTLGNHLAVIDPNGEVIDSLCRRYADEARHTTSDDEAMFKLLTRHYLKHLAS